MRNLKAGSKILIMNLGGIGDILLSLPALKALKNSYPESRISMLVSQKNYTFVKGLSYVDEVFMFNFEYGGVMFLDKAIPNLLTLITLRKKKFDLAVNMRTLVSKKSAEKIKFMFDIIRPSFTAGRDTEGRGYFFDIKVPETDIGEKYEMEYDIDTIGALGVKVLDKNIDLSVEDIVLRQLEKKLELEKIYPADILIGIHPGGMPSRRWKIDNFAQVIKAIDKQIKCRFVVTGSSDECQLALELAGISGVKAVNMAGKLTLEELEALIKRCNVYISNDTGPMHIAAILKVPLVAIFGPGDINRFDPRIISGNVKVMYNKVDCSPCNKKECDSMRCLNIISPEEVVSAALKFIKSNSQTIYGSFAAVNRNEVSANLTLSDRRESKGQMGRIPRCLQQGCSLRLSLIERFYGCIRRFSSKPEERGEYSAGYWQAQVRQTVLRMIPPDSGSVLEVGCGEGLFLAQLASTYERMQVVGVDNWKDILLKAERRIQEKHLGRVNLFQADAFSLPFKDCYFDTAVCINVIFNLKSNEVVNGVLKEMSRVCKNSGRIIFDFRNACDPFLCLKYKLAPYYDPTVKNLPLKTYRLGQMCSSLNKAGLKIIKQKHIGSMIKNLAPIIIIEAKKNDK